MLNMYAKRIELMEMRKNIKRVFYRGQFTKKYLRYIALCIKYHVYDEVDAAEKTKKLLREFREKYPNEFR